MYRTYWVAAVNSFVGGRRRDDSEREVSYYLVIVLHNYLGVVSDGRSRAKRRRYLDGTRRTEKPRLIFPTQGSTVHQ